MLLLLKLLQERLRLAKHIADADQRELVCKKLKAERSSCVTAAAKRSLQSGTHKTPATVAIVAAEVPVDKSMVVSSTKVPVGTRSVAFAPEMNVAATIRKVPRVVDEKPYGLGTAGAHGARLRTADPMGMELEPGFLPGMHTALSTVDDKPYKPLPNTRLTAENPCKCFRWMCMGWAALMVVLGLGLSIAGGLTPDFGTPPFYDRSEINQARMESWVALVRDNDYIERLRESAIPGSCVHMDPTQLSRRGALSAGPAPAARCQRSSSSYYLQLVFISTDMKSNILRQSTLQQIKKVEDYLLAQPGLSRYCHLIDTNLSPLTARANYTTPAAAMASSIVPNSSYAACERMMSATNFLDPWYMVADPSANGGYPGYIATSADYIEQIPNLNQTNIDSVFGGLASSPTSHPVLLTTSSDYGGADNSRTAIGVQSIYRLGLPINGYTSASGDSDEQYTEAGEWLWDHFNDYFKDVSIDGVDFYWQDSKAQMSAAEGAYLTSQVTTASH